MRLPQDDFVSEIVGNPADTPDAILVTGFLGKSTGPDMTRIYLDVMLGSFVDVRDTAILHARRISEAQSPLGGWYIWLKRDLEMVDMIRDAYTRLSKIQQEYVDDLRQTTDGFSGLQPGWPQMPTG
ncbi:hypothetical protein NKH09_28595 [Mesorhizobium sp. M1339]|uniref:hypothetical protein n=1 Tax=Mesorhizobium sp. M1339 TaxID=2957086 RepID=UPI00333877B5